MHAAGKIAISRKQGCRDRTAADRVGHLALKGSRVSDAGGASVADDAETDGLKLGKQAASPQNSSADGEPGASDVLTQ